MTPHLWKVVLFRSLHARLGTAPAICFKSGLLQRRRIQKRSQGKPGRPPAHHFALFIYRQLASRRWDLPQADVNIFLTISVLTLDISIGW